MPQKFGWAHVFEADSTGAAGPVEGIQFKTDETHISGSDNFTYASGSNTVKITGSLEVTGSALFIAHGFVGVNVVGNKQTINHDTETGTDINAVLYGPITIASSKSLKIGLDSNVKIKNIEDV